MTLERLTERIQEEKDKIGKADGRRFNARSRTKESWQMKNIKKSIALSERKRRHSANRSTYTREELVEYKEIEDKFREDMRSKVDAPEEKSSNNQETPPGSPPTKRTRCTPTTPPCTPTRSTSVPPSTPCTPSSPSTRRKYTA